MQYPQGEIEYLEWDSNFFGYSVGSAHATDDRSLRSFEQQLTSSNFDLVYLNCHQFIPGRTSLGEYLIELVDRRAIFEKHITNPSNSKTANVISYEGSPREDLYSLAIRSSKHSRFRKDERLKSKCDELYKLWMDKCLGNNESGQVLVHTNDTLFNGLLTTSIKGKTARIELLAVSAESQGKGIATQLITAVERELALQGIEDCEVATQAENVRACTLYRSAGFEPHPISNLFHCWKR